jgi:siroheme synthase (precorrin-2 oxidase/ferrochelatase)
MDIKAKIRESLKEQYGEFVTYLEHEYENKLTENLADGDIDKKRAWLTYNQVILELKHTLKNMLKVRELQYKLTDDDDPNEVCISVMEDIKNQTEELERLYNKIANF